MVLSKGPLPSAESVCAVCDWSIGESEPRAMGPGAPFGWMSVKGYLSDPNNQ